jgi:hypothetical protein
MYVYWIRPWRSSYINQQVKRFFFVRALFDTYFKPKKKPALKNRCQKLVIIFQTYLKPIFTIWKLKINIIKKIVEVVTILKWIIFLNDHTSKL